MNVHHQFPVQMKRKIEKDTEFGEIPKVKPKELLIINDRIVKSICQAVVASSTGGQWQDK